MDWHQFLSDKQREALKLVHDNSLADAKVVLQGAISRYRREGVSQAGSQGALISSLNTLARVFERDGDTSKALKCLEHANTFSQDCDHSTHANLCAVFIKLGRLTDALHHADQALALLAPMKPSGPAADSESCQRWCRNVTIVSQNRAACLARLGKVDAAKVSAARALKVAQKFLDPNDMLLSKLHGLLKELEEGSTQVMPLLSERKPERRVKRVKTSDKESANSTAPNQLRCQSPRATNSNMDSIHHQGAHEGEESDSVPENYSHSSRSLSSRESRRQSSTISTDVSDQRALSSTRSRSHPKSNLQPVSHYHAAVPPLQPKQAWAMSLQSSTTSSPYQTSRKSDSSAFSSSRESNHLEKTRQNNVAGDLADSKKYQQDSLVVTDNGHTMESTLLAADLSASAATKIQSIFRAKKCQHNFAYLMHHKYQCAHATVIQKLWRKFQSCVKFRSILKSVNARRTLERELRDISGPITGFSSEHRLRVCSAVAIQRHARGYLCRSRLDIPSSVQCLRLGESKSLCERVGDARIMETSAIKIQSVVRKRLRCRIQASQLICRVVQGHTARRSVAILIDDARNFQPRSYSAAAIQMCFRKHQAKQRYDLLHKARACNQIKRTWRQHAFRKNCKILCMLHVNLAKQTLSRVLQSIVQRRRVSQMFAIILLQRSCKRAVMQSRYCRLRLTLSHTILAAAIKRTMAMSAYSSGQTLCAAVAALHPRRRFLLHLQSQVAPRIQNAWRCHLARFEIRNLSSIRHRHVQQIVHDVQNWAAGTLSRSYICHLARKSLDQQRQMHTASSTIYYAWKCCASRREMAAARLIVSRWNFAIKLQQAFRQFCARRELKRLASIRLRLASAPIIQRSWRAHASRKELVARFKSTHKCICAKTIQTAFRHKLARKALRRQSIRVIVISCCRLRPALEPRQNFVQELAKLHLSSALHRVLLMARFEQQLKFIQLKSSCIILSKAARRSIWNAAFLRHMSAVQIVSSVKRAFCRQSYAHTAMRSRRSTAAMFLSRFIRTAPLNVQYSGFSARRAISSHCLRLGKRNEFVHRRSAELLQYKLLRCLYNHRHVVSVYSLRAIVIQRFYKLRYWRVALNHCFNRLRVSKQILRFIHVKRAIDQRKYLVRKKCAIVLFRFISALNSTLEYEKTRATRHLWVCIQRFRARVDWGKSFLQVTSIKLQACARYALAARHPTCLVIRNRELVCRLISSVKAWRVGAITRSRLTKPLWKVRAFRRFVREFENAQKLQGICRGHFGRKYCSAIHIGLKDRAARVIQAHAMFWLVKKYHSERKARLNFNRAGSTIAKAWRCHLARLEKTALLRSLALQLCSAAARRIQSAAKFFLLRVNARKEYRKRLCAMRIYLAMKCHIARRKILKADNEFVFLHRLRSAMPQVHESVSLPDTIKPQGQNTLTNSNPLPKLDLNAVHNFQKSVQAKDTSVQDRAEEECLATVRSLLHSSRLISHRLGLSGWQDAIEYATNRSHSLTEQGSTTFSKPDMEDKPSSQSPRSHNAESDNSSAEPLVSPQNFYRAHLHSNRKESERTASARHVSVIPTSARNFGHEDELNAIRAKISQIVQGTMSSIAAALEEKTTDIDSAQEQSGRAPSSVNGRSVTSASESESTDDRQAWAAGTSAAATCSYSTRVSPCPDISYAEPGSEGTRHSELTVSNSFERSSLLHSSLHGSISQSSKQIDSQESFHHTNSRSSSDGLPQASGPNMGQSHYILQAATSVSSHESSIAARGQSWQVLQEDILCSDSSNASSNSLLPSDRSLTSSAAASYFNGALEKQCDLLSDRSMPALPDIHRSTSGKNDGNSTLTASQFTPRKSSADFASGQLSKQDVTNGGIVNVDGRSPGNANLKQPFSDVHLELENALQAAMTSPSGSLLSPQNSMIPADSEAAQYFSMCMDAWDES